MRWQSIYDVYTRWNGADQTGWRPVGLIRAEWDWSHGVALRDNYTAVNRLTFESSTPSSGNIRWLACINPVYTWAMHHSVACCQTSEYIWLCLNALLAVVVRWFTIGLNWHQRIERRLVVVYLLHVERELASTFMKCIGQILILKNCSMVGLMERDRRHSIPEVLRKTTQQAAHPFNVSICRSNARSTRCEAGPRSTTSKFSTTEWQQPQQLQLFIDSLSITVI